MVTYKDYAFVTNYLAPYFTNFPTTNQANLYLRLHIRYSGAEHTPIADSNQTNYLMQLPDTQLIQAMVGSLSNVPVWQAASLENSAYTALMRSSYNQITQPLVEQAYGYTKANWVLGQTPITIPPETTSVTLPPAFQLGATSFEYNAAGVLLGYYAVAANSLTYSIVNTSCTNVEFVSGVGGTTLDEYYDLVPVTVTPGNNYRYYIYAPNLATGITSWVDATDTGDYVITGSVSNWSPTVPSGVLKRLVRSDKRFLLYQATLTPVDGLLVHQLTYTQNTLSGQLQSGVTIPLGELDVWLNGYSLVEGVDFIFNFPMISIISKEYLSTTPGPQTLTIRFTGFCNSSLETTPLNEVGYVYNGVLSANGAYDLHSDRVQRIVIAGAMVPVADVSFIENTTTGSLVDGAPYSIRDVVNPLNNLIDQDPYAFYTASKSVEKTVSNYLTVATPQVTASPINPITDKYVLYSPFIGKIIYDLTQGYIVNSQLDGAYSDSLVMQLCEPYPYLFPKTKKSKTMNTQQQKSNQFSAVPAKSVVAKTNSLEDLVKNGIGSQVVKSKSGYAHSPKATSLLLKAMGSFKNTTAKQTIDKENGIDGVDFINTASSGDTPLGRALDINYHIRFQYQSTGWFASVGAVWFYLLADTQDESLRNLYGVSCRNIRERITPRHVEGFRTIIADATWAKINSNKHFVAAIVKNELPYVCFYAKNISDKQGKQTTQVVDSSIAYWYVAVIEEIARTLKESAKTGNTELIPDFSFIENLYENAYRKQA